MGQRSKWAFVQRRHPGGHRAHGKMLNVTNYWRNANQNCAMVSPHTHQHSWHPNDLQILGAAEGEGNRESSYTVGGEGNRRVQPRRKTVWTFLKTLTIDLVHDPASPLLGLNPERILILNDTRSPLFRAALLAISKAASTKISINREMKSKRFICTLNTLSLQQNEKTPLAAPWMDRELCYIEWSQSEKERNTSLTGGIYKFIKMN